MTMTTLHPTQKFQRRRASRHRRGIILLIVLGMLTLFSVLAVSYLVFTSRNRAAAAAIQRVERATIDPDPWLDDALTKLIVGANGPESSLWAHDLLGDLYGMRDAIQGQMSVVVAGNISEPEVLLGGFVRIPTELDQTASYPNRRVDATAPEMERDYPNRPPPTPPPPPLRFTSDDELSGRILTFVEGPLQGVSMRILRYFGDHSGAINGRNILSGQLVLDFRPHLQRAVTVNSLSRTETLGDWIKEDSLAGTFDISELFYDRTSTATPNQPLSEFYINGRILNGPGLGWDLVRDSTLTATGSDMNLNETISTDFNPITAVPTNGNVKAASAYAKPSAGADVPVSMQGHYALYRRAPDAAATTRALDYLQDLPAGDSDESYDAPDDQNWWLSYFPTDPRLGSGTPSFVRPGVVNWLLNQEGGSLSGASTARLQQVLRAIQRSTLRPLAITNDPTMPTAIANRAEGVLQLDYSKFTGSNSSALGTPIDYTSVTADQIRELARALAGIDLAGSSSRVWDVDNNGDGVPDGVWVDSGAPLTQDENGKLMKPLVSYLVEDLSGRVNVNLSGNQSQAQNRIQRSSSGIVYRQNFVPTSTTISHNDLPNGFGYGPAEIDIRHVFASAYAVGNGPFELLRRRLNEYTIGGNVHIVSGQAIDPLTASGNDFMGSLRQPNLTNLHSPGNSQGLPVDKFGRTSIALGIDGGLMVSGGSSSVNLAGSDAGDAEDDPYEMDMFPGRHPDRPFSLADLEALLRFDDFDRDALDSQLVALADAHFQGTPAQTQAVNVDKKGFADSVTTISNSVADNVGIPPLEYRGNLTESREALSPQSLVTRRFPGLTLTTEQRNAILMQILPQSVLAGGKFDLNRPFGNGIDDDGDGVIDDPEEVRTAIESYYTSFYRTQDVDATVLVPNPGGAFREPSPQALFARHLYVMTLSVLRNVSGAPIVFDLSGGAGITIDPTNQTNKRDTAGSPIPNVANDEYRAWRIAQWAINVADFRDPDGIISRFDYDVDPFDGWDIINLSGSPTYRTVWGMEYPELALEESIAFHDRRVRDTALDIAGQKRTVTFSDPHPDQWRLPQGSLYLELRSTRSPDYMRVATDDTDDVAQAWGVPRELYSVVDTGGGNMEYMLNLARTAPDRNPVWRVAITRAHPTTAARTGAADIELSADELIRPTGSTQSVPFTAPLNRLTATMQPERPDFFGPTIINPIERVIWFGDQNPDDGLPGTGSNPGDTVANDGTVNFAPIDSNSIEKIFYNRHAESDYAYFFAANTTTEVYLRGGQYAVIGPRTITSIGSLDQHAVSGAVHDATTSEPLVTYDEFESPQRFILQPQNFEHRSFTDTSTTATLANGVTYATRRDVVGILAAANPPAGWTGPRLVGDPATGTVQAVGLSVSEPLPVTGAYYQTPTSRLKPGFPFDSWYDFPAATGNLPSVPFDAQPYAELLKIFDDGTTAEFQPGQQTGTRERFKTAYLQRLADPSEPHNSLLNPYITVDYITIDLTVFNGSEANRQQTIGAVTEWIDQADPNPFAVVPNEAFATRYKTGRTIFDAKNVPGITENLSHSANTFPPQPTNASTALGGHVPYFDHALLLEPGLDPDAGPPAPPLASRADAIPSRIIHSSTLGYANASYGERWSTGNSTAISTYAGTPVRNWFSTVGWLNRPYVSKGELMLAPTTSAAGFITSFGTATTDTGFLAGGNIYDGTGNAVGNRTEYNRVFPHLWNFYGQDPDFTNSLNMHRILDWVDVQAPFDFENDFLSTNPDVLNLSNVSGAGLSRWSGRLNYTGFGATVTDNPDSWTAPPNSTFWLNRWTIEAFRPPFNILQPQYRQGRINLNTIKSIAVYQALMSGSSTTTLLQDAFTDSRRGYTIPTVPLESALGTLFFHPDHASQMSGAFRHSSGSDLSSLSGASHRLTNPLARTTFRPGGIPGAFTNTPLFTLPLGVSPISDEFAERSVVHQQLATTRLSNLSTNQSNTFAVWITVGLFEVDGSDLSVGAEVGSGIGKTRRYRAFHIIDRSIPVMYQPGQLNNAKETVLLSRRLN